MRYATQHGVFHVEPLVGIPQVAWCYGFYVPIRQRGHGHGHKLEAEQVEALIAGQYDFAITTTRLGNTAKQACLQRTGWFPLSEFYNRNTGEHHQLWGRQINHPPQEHNHGSTSDH